MTEPTALRRLRDGLPVIAVNVGGRNPDVLATLAAAGAHVALVDCERTGIGLDVATELIRAAKCSGISSVVRSWSKDPAVLVQYLDRQADGLIVPHINTAQDAADVVELVRYACGAKASEKMVIVQIETVQAVTNLQGIMEVPGVDAYLIGPNDLAYSMMGQRGAQVPAVLEAVAHISSQLRAQGKRFGMPARWDQLADFQATGATFLYFPIEWLLQRALLELSQKLNLALH